MKYTRFEHLPVWQAASQLFQRLDTLCDDRQLRLPGDLADQLHRAALSISNNIAEGFELGTTAQLIAHLYIARGSAGEVRSMLINMEALPRLSNLRSEISNLKSLAESTSRQLHGFANSLQNSDIEGARHLTDARLEAIDKKKRSDAFLAKLSRLTAHARGEVVAEE